MELAQIYVVDCELHTFDRSQEPPFTTDTRLDVAGVRQEDTVEVRAKYTTEASKELEGEDGSALAPLWTVGIECVAAFAVTSEDADFTDDELEGFALLVGAPAIHPYAREVTQDLSGRTLYPAFTLGLLRSFAEMAADVEVELAERPGLGGTATT